MSKQLLLVIDANVLIDYAKTDVSVLELVAKHIAPVMVPRSLLREVDQIDESVCERLGLTLVDGTIDQLLEAGLDRGKGGLSFVDRLCLILARDGKWTCVSNDRPLRKACEREGIPVRWGLSLMIDLVAAGHLPPEDSVEIAEAIHASNPRFITKEIVSEFGKRARSAAPKQSKH
jgi:predicted nucleic acid-binding protein